MTDQIVEDAPRKGLPSYPDVYTFGETITHGMLEGAVVVQAKVDGSQCSAGLVEENGKYDLRIRSKNKAVYMHGVRIDGSGMFARAITAIQTLPLHPGWIYRMEFIGDRDCPKCQNGSKAKLTCSKCGGAGTIAKHNCIEYGRIPKNMLMLYDVEVEYGKFLDPLAMAEEAIRIGLESVPIIFVGETTNDELVAMTEEWLKRPSVLGKNPDEGVVIKRYDRFDRFGKVLMAKIVREDFKEANKINWKADNATAVDVVDRLVLELRTDARYRKAVQHGKESGEVVGEMRDLKYLFDEVPRDLLKEEEEYIKRKLFDHAWPHIKRRVVSGLPEFYRKYLEDEYRPEVKEQ